MLLNDHIAGLPEWPPIRIDKETGEYVVGAPHVTRSRYVLARWIGGLLLIGYVLLALGIAFVMGDFKTGAIVFAILFVPALVAMNVFPAGKLLSQWFFPCKTVVRFGPKSIIIDGKKFDNTGAIAIQFRANRPVLSEGSYYDRIIEKQNKGQLHKGLAYELKFRKIEMIYGSRIVPITSVADEDRAAQFAVALQSGFELARIRHSEGPSASSPKKEKDLPE